MGEKTVEDYFKMLFKDSHEENLEIPQPIWATSNKGCTENKAGMLTTGLLRTTFRVCHVFTSSVLINTTHGLYCLLKILF